MNYVAKVNVLLLLTTQSICISLAPNFPICYIDDPNINGCLLNAAQELKPQILKGIDDLGLPSFDPLIIPNLQVEENNNALQINVTFSNFTVKGFESYDFRHIGYDPETKSFYGSLKISLLEFDTSVSIKARILFIPVEGTGRTYVNFGPFDGSFKVEGKIVTENGIEFYNPTRADINLVVSDGYYRVSGLFDNNTDLNYYTNGILNKNSQAVAYASTPLLKHVAEEGLLWLMRSLSSKVPYKQLFPYSKETLNKV